MEHESSFKITVKTKKKLTDDEKLELMHDFKWRLEGYTTTPPNCLDDEDGEMEITYMESLREAKRKKINEAIKKTEESGAYEVVEHQTGMLDFSAEEFTELEMEVAREIKNNILDFIGSSKTIDHYPRSEVDKINPDRFLRCLFSLVKKKEE